MENTSKVLITLGVLGFLGVGGYFGYRQYLESDVLSKYKQILQRDGAKLEDQSTKDFLAKVQAFVNKSSFADLSLYQEAISYLWQALQVPKPYETEEVFPDPNGTKYNQSRMLLTENGKKNEQLRQKGFFLINKMSKKPYFDY